MAEEAGNILCNGVWVAATRVEDEEVTVVGMARRGREEVILGCTAERGEVCAKRERSATKYGQSMKM